MLTGEQKEKRARGRQEVRYTNIGTERRETARKSGRTAKINKRQGIRREQGDRWGEQYSDEYVCELDSVSYSYHCLEEPQQEHQSKKTDKHEECRMQSVLEKERNWETQERKEGNSLRLLRYACMSKTKSEESIWCPKMEVRDERDKVECSV